MSSFSEKDTLLASPPAADQPDSVPVSTYLFGPPPAPTPQDQYDPDILAGKAFKYAGGVAKGAVEDVATAFYEHPILQNLPNVLSAAAKISGLPKKPTSEAPSGYFSNITAALKGEETPYEKETKDVGGVSGVTSKVAQSAAEMLPQMLVSEGVGAGLKAGGMSPLAASSAASGIVFGTTERGFDPKTAAMMAAFPKVSALGGEALEGALGKLGVKVTSEAGKKGIETAGGFLASQAYLDAAAIPDYQKMKPEDRANEWAKNFGLNLAMHLNAVPGIIKTGIEERGRSAQIKQISDQIAKQYQRDFWNNFGSRIPFKEVALPRGILEPTGEPEPAQQPQTYRDVITGFFDRKGDENATGIRSDQGQPEKTGQTPQGGQADSGSDVQQTPPRPPTPQGQEEKPPPVNVPSVTAQAEKETGWTFNPNNVYGMTPESAAQLKPEDLAQLQPTHEFTDKRPGSPTEGFTVNVPHGSTLDDIKGAINRKTAEVVDSKAIQPYEKTLKDAQKNGILVNVGGAGWTSVTGNRPVVFMKVGTGVLPFYRSSQGTGGAKKAGEWQPFFGVGNNAWIIKGTNEQIRTNYGQKDIKNAQEWLNKNLNWPHELDSDLVYNKHRTPLNYLSPMGRFAPAAQEIFGDSQFEGVSHDDGTSDKHINSILDRLFPERATKPPVQAPKPAPAATETPIPETKPPVVETPAPPAETPPAPAPAPTPAPETPAQPPAKTPSEIAADFIKGGRGAVLPEQPKEELNLRPAIDRIADHIRNGPITKQQLNDILAEVYGGTLASGKFSSKDLTDVLEGAINRIVLDRKNGQPIWDIQASGNRAGMIAGAIKSFLDANIPTQSTRTDEMVKMQQFSTPPHLAYVVNWVANLHPKDIVLEPSAGIGGIAAFPKSIGAKVIANELSPRRAEILRSLDIADYITGNNAENLHALYEPKIQDGTIPRPTAVVMNPPFSNAARTDQKSSTIGAQHIEQALKLLPKGGRLVAIVGEGMADDRPAFKGWWAQMKRQYNVRANVGISGEEYRKYGTSFDNQLLVIDKTGPTTSPTVTGKVDRVSELPAILERVRNERPSIEPTPAEPGSTGEAGTTTPATRPGPNAPVGSGPPRDSGRGSPKAGEQGSDGLEPDQPVSSVGTGLPTNLIVTGGNSPEHLTVTGKDNNGNPAVLVDGVTLVKKEQGQRELNDNGVFSEYEPQKVHIPNSKPHPTPLVEPTAMAAVEPVDPNYQPRIDAKLIADGVLSDSQMENVIYAGQSHQVVMPNGQRQGYFIGDGTGVGKGRQIGGVILDNWNQGRKKHVWLSKSKGLINDAIRDLTALGFNAQDAIDLVKNKGALLEGKNQGIAFVPYSSLRSENPGLDPATTEPGMQAKLRPPKDKDKLSRMHRLYNWLGPDFDGVIVFDEAHQAGNAITIKGKRGMKEASEQGKMVVDLQRLFPNARVVYASATGATDVTNLSYADRLGIWGPGSPFPTKTKFFETIQAGGLSAMEIVARDLKAMGRYLARTLSFQGVEREQVTHHLTPEQKKIYNTLARGWQGVLENVNETLGQTGASNNGMALGKARSAFYGAQQRFYNQLLTAMQMPTIIARAKAELAKGNSIVMQIVNTNESTLNREIGEKSAEKTEEGDTGYLEDLDLSPMDILLNYVDQSYPTQKYVPEADEDGNVRWVPLMDGNKPVQDPDAIRRKNELLARLASLKAPSNPLEMLMDTFGSDNVSEITGRTRRVVLKKQDDGSMKRVIENRNDNLRKIESQEFQDGKRRILVFSDAGGTGFSYHASNRAKNQQRRIHFLIQAGWKADTAIQGFGRTHRSDQASAPFYVIPSTDLKGHQRFISTISRRLGELGALTGGERKAAGGEMFSDTSNLENKYAEDGLVGFMLELYAGKIPDLNFDDITRKLGYTKNIVDPETGETTQINTLLKEGGGLNVTKLPTIQQFLNRILSLEFDEQNHVFDEFFERMQNRIENAKEDGSYDPGTQQLKALSIKKLSDQQVYQHEGSTARTRLVEIESEHPTKITKFDDIRALLPNTPVAFWARSIRNGKLFAFKEGRPITDEQGNITERWLRISPTGYLGIVKGEVKTENDWQGNANYNKVEFESPEEAKKAWDDELSKTPKTYKKRDTYVVGSFLPIWDRLQIQNPKIWRITTDEKENLLGAYVHPKAVDELRRRMGAGLGAQLSPHDVYSNVLDRGLKYELSNGWTMKRVRVTGENRIEVSGLSYEEGRQWESHYGGIKEQISWKDRYFVPADDARGPETISKVLARSPIVQGEGDKQLSLDTGEMNRDIRPASGIGVEEIRRMLNAPESGLNRNSVRVANALLNTPQMQDLNWNRLAVELQPGEKEFSGEARIKDMLIRLSSSSTPRTFPHEVFHFLYELLPEDYKKAIQAARSSEAQATLKDRQNFTSIFDGKMTSDQFLDSGLPTSLYHLINPSEFFADFASKKFEAEAMEGKYDKPASWWDNFWTKIKNWVRGIVYAVRANRGLSPDMDTIYRQLIDGMWRPDPQGSAESERQLSLVRNPKEYAKQQEFGERIVPERTLAARGDVAEMKRRAAQTLGAGEDAQRLVQLPVQSMLAAQAGIDLRVNHFALDNYDRIRSITERSDPGTRWNVIQDALHALGDEQRRSNKIRDLYEEKKKLIQSQDFEKKLGRLWNVMAEKDAVKDITATFTNQIGQEASKILKELSIKGKTDAAYQQLRSALKRVEELKDFPTAVAQRVQDIIDTVSSTEEGEKLLFEGGDETGDKIYRAYLDIKNTTNPQPRAGMAGVVPEEFLSEEDKAKVDVSKLPVLSEDAKAASQLASRVLAVNGQLRLRLMNLEKIKNNPKFAAAVGAVGEAFRKRYAENPENAIKQIAKTAAKYQRKEMDAETAWYRLSRQVMPELHRFEALRQAVDIDTVVQNSPEWKSLVNRIHQDAGAMRIPDEELRHVTSQTVFNEFNGRQNVRTPYGNQYTIDLGYTRASAERAQDSMFAYQGELERWLSDPQNANSPDRKYWEWRRDFVDSALNVSTVLSPTSTRPLLNIRSAWTMMEFFFKEASLPDAKIAFTASNNFQRAWAIADQWYNGVEGQWMSSLIRAAKSHQYDPNTELRNYREEVLDRLANEYRRGNALVAGDRLNNGVVLTAQDILALKQQGESMKSLMEQTKNIGREKLMTDRMLVDEWAKNVFALRAPQELGALPGTTLPHEFSRRAIALSTLVAGLGKGDVEGFKRLMDSENNFQSFVQRFFAERSADYSRESQWESLYKPMAELWKMGGPDAPTNMDEVIDWLHDHSDGSIERDDMEPEIIGEMWRQLASFHTNFVAKEDVSDTSRALRASKDSAFTKGFQRDVGSSFFYEYGAVSSPEIRSLAIDSTNFHLVRFVRSLDAALQGYDKAMAELNNSIDPKKFTKERMADFRSGADYRNWERIKSEREQLKYLKENIALAYGSQSVKSFELFSNMNRLLGDNITATLSGLNTVAKVTVGSIGKMGLVLGAFERFYMSGFVKGIASTVASMARMAYGAVRHVPVETIRSMKGGSGFWDSIAQGLETSVESTFRQGKFFNDQYRFGLGFKNPVGYRIYNNLMLPYSHGRGYDARLSNSAMLRLPQKAFYRMMSTAVEPPLEIVKAIFPQIGYSISYDAVARAGTSTLDAIAAQARRSFEFLEETGALGVYDLDRPSNLQNILPAAYILPGGIFEKGQTELNFARDWFQRAIDLPLNELVINYWKKLSETPKERRGEVSFLASDATGDAIRRKEDDRAGALMAVLLKDVHHASPENRPLDLRVNPLLRMIFPMMGWTTQSLRQTLQLLGKAPQDTGFRPVMLMASAATMATVMAGFTAVGELEKQAKRLISQYIFGEEYPERSIWQAENAKDLTKLAFLDATTIIPYVHTIAANLIGEFGTAAANNGIQVFTIQKAQALLKYLSGVIHTHDPTYGLPQFARQMVPALKPFINELDSQQGLLKERSFEVLAAKYGPEFLKKVQFASFQAPTELTPYKVKLENAIYSGDVASAQQAYNDFVAKANELGVSDPQKLAQQAVASMNPYQRAFGQKLTDEQRQQFIGKLDERELGVVQTAEHNYAQAVSAFGGTASFEKQQRGVTPAPSQGTYQVGYQSGSGAGRGRIRSGFGSRRPRLSTRLRSRTPRVRHVTGRLRRISRSSVRPRRLRV